MSKFWEKDEETRMQKKTVMYLMTFFIVSFVIDMSFIYASKFSYSGVVTEKPYDKGISYNDTIIKNNNQESLDWKFNIQLNCITNEKPFYQLSDYSQKKYKNFIKIDASLQTNVKQKSCSAFVSLYDLNNRPLANKRGKIMLIRPVTSAINDIEVVLQNHKNGEYYCNIPLENLGLWEIRVYFGDERLSDEQSTNSIRTDNDYEFFFSKKIIIL